MYDHREMVLTLTNRQDMPYTWNLAAPPHFGVAPTSGTLPPMGSREVTISFKPNQVRHLPRSPRGSPQISPHISPPPPTTSAHPLLASPQVGELGGSLQLLGFGGKVATQAIKLLGECTAPTKRAPLGGITLLPEDFYKPPKIVEQSAIAFPPAPIGKGGWARPPKWEMSESLQGGKVQQGGSEPLERLRSLAKAKTYERQMQYQPMLDAIEQMDTGLELPPAAIKAAAEHRNYYNTYLQTQREAREARNKAKHVSQPDAEKFLFGVDLGLDPFSGCAPLVPPLPSEVQPLFLHHPYGDGNDAKAGLSSALFDPFRTGGKKYKARPETSDEMSECKMTLSPTDLECISGGPKTLDFGTISVFTNVTRCFTVINELRTSCLVSVDLSAEDDFVSVKDQVVPPNGIAGFDLTFSSPTAGTFRRTITYTVNGCHAFKFVATANVVPIEVSLSVEELTFRFPDGSLDPAISQTVFLHNSGTYPAKVRPRTPPLHAAPIVRVPPPPHAAPIVPPRRPYPPSNLQCPHPFRRAPPPLRAVPLGASRHQLEAPAGLHTFK